MLHSYWFVFCSSAQKSLWLTRIGNVEAELWRIEGGMCAQPDRRGGRHGHRLDDGFHAVVRVYHDAWLALTKKRRLGEVRAERKVIISALPRLSGPVVSRWSIRKDSNL